MNLHLIGLISFVPNLLTSHVWESYQDSYQESILCSKMEIDYESGVIVVNGYREAFVVFMVEMVLFYLCYNWMGSYLSIKKYDIPD